MTTDSALAQFTISTDSDDGGIWLEHRNGDCDWRGYPAAFPSLSGVIAFAGGHAKVCDGRPQPRQEPVVADGPGLWDSEIKRQLSATLR